MASDALSLRGERDRFVAFAFASADLLLEVDAEGRICFAAGAAQRLCGRTPQELLSQIFTSLIGADDRPMVSAVLASIRRGGRFAPLLVRLASDRPRVVILGGCCLPERTGHYFLSLSAAIRTRERTPRPAGLLHADTFLERAQARAAAGSHPGKMSLVGLEGLGSLAEGLPENVREGLPAALGSQILASSPDIEEVGEIAEGRFGLLHTGPLDVEELRHAVESFATGLDPAGAGLKLQATTIDLARGTLSEPDAARAVMHAITQFARSGETAASISSLQESVASLIGASTRHVTVLRHVVTDGAFSIAVQPIVDLSNGTPVHLEALSRFGRDLAPGDIVSLAEEIGLISDFDMAVCRRVLGLLRDATFSATAIAVNVSGQSWASDAFVEALTAELETSAVPASKLIFEITETAGIADIARANGVVQSLRRRGHRFCLDDFGAGASSFHYLRALEVDYVKIDGQFCRDAMNQPRARALLGTVIGFCRKNQITSIGEMIETRHQASVLQKLGLQLGQGYLFGKPEIVEPMHLPPETTAEGAPPAAAASARRAEGDKRLA
ncbi:MAG TPA: EAL domain-containing protein [Stellaceae bacterium]|nr:EAL domain-containing protein [Stellaceae bacterium]